MTSAVCEQSHDTHRTGYLTQQGVRAVLQALAVRPLDDIQAQVFFTLDPQRFGRIEIDELVEYMATVSISSVGSDGVHLCISFVHHLCSE